jgi:hypothetical protein
MSDRRFPIFCAADTKIVGREAIIRRMLGSLSKARPNHLEVVGPRYSGKSVVLHELMARLRKQDRPFASIVQWDLGLQVPTTNDQFMDRFARELSIALKQKYPDYSEHLKNSESPYQDISEVLDLLKEDEAKILVVMDGVDRLLTRGHLTRNLWDQLREHASRPSLCLVTASQRSLRELIRDPDTQSSEFFNIFEKVRIPCFNDDDLNAALETLEGLRLSAGARTELWNAANGFPVMTLEVLNVLSGNEGESEIAPERVVAACDEAFLQLKDRLGALWSDCSTSTQDLMRRVLEEGSVVRGKGIVAADFEPLVDRGFVTQDGNKITRASRLLQKYLEGQPSEDSELVTLFSSAEAYKRNLVGVLERRISQIEGIDLDLKRYLENGVRDLPEHPGEFLGRIHGTLERVLTLIWKIECWNSEAGKPRIPSEWFSTWKECGETGFDRWIARFPEGGGRLRLLDLMTGTQSTDRLSRCVTKNSYVLANALLQFRNFGVHPKATDVDLGTAYVALHTCIELAAVVTQELRPATAELL